MPIETKLVRKKNEKDKSAIRKNQITLSPSLVS